MAHEGEASHEGAVGTRVGLTLCTLGFARGRPLHEDGRCCTRAAFARGLASRFAPWALHEDGRCTRAAFARGLPLHEGGLCTRTALMLCTLGFAKGWA